MKSIAVSFAVLALLIAAGPAEAAGRSIAYKGKTDAGHKITFSVKSGKRVVNLETGIPVSCLPIQGGGSPTGGPEVFGFEGSVPYAAHATWSFMSKPAFHYNEVTMNHDLWLDKRSKRAISGRIRIQYQFMVPKYTPGTFSIYSCLGSAKFNAKAKRG